jgi:GNAT superfamily N-acetyltransferase
MSKINQFVLDANIAYIRTKYKNIVQDYKLECTPDDDGYCIQLVLIKIKKSQRHKGYGSAIMYELCRLADNYNVRIRLYATNLYGADLKALYAFYGKHGFVLIKNDNIGEMLYYPVKIVD